MTTIDNYRTLVTAEELIEGDRIPGKLSGDIYEVRYVQKGADDILGNMVEVVVWNPEQEYTQTYTFRPFDKIWILS